MQSMIRMLAASAAAAVLTGCAIAGRPVANFELPVDNFPDVSGYTEIDSDSFYIRDGNPEYGFGFTTPFGFTCGMGSYPMPEYAHVRCSGLRPDKGPGYWEVSAERYGAAATSTASASEPHQASGDPPLRELRERQFVIDSVDTMCVVTNDSVVACHVGEHGFILTPTSTTLF